MEHTFNKKLAPASARLTALGLSLAVCAGTAVAAEPLPPEGALMRTLLGDDAVSAMHGWEISGFAEGGYVYNFDANPGNGGGNGPGVPNGDTGFQLNNVGIKIDKPIRANMIPRAFPLPGPVPGQYDFGVQGWLTYGRSSIAALSAGWDADWRRNRVDPADGTRNRHNYLSNQELFLKAYMPWGNGMTVLFGKFLSPVSNEIGLPMRQATVGNFFYSRPYTFYGQPVTHTGLLVSANLWRTPEAGLWMAEAGIVRGWNNYDDNNSGKSVLAAVHWRSGDLSSGLDYRLYRGADQNDPQRDPQFGGNRILSASSQIKQVHSLGGYLPLAPRWQGYAELTYGKQAGDGSASTVDILTGPRFAGATWNGQTAGVLYQHTDRLGFGFRLERFNDPKGFGMYPLTVTGSKYFAQTLGLSFQLIPSVRLRSELRHDKQSDNAGVGVFNGRSRNMAWSTDLTAWF